MSSTQKKTVIQFPKPEVPKQTAPHNPAAFIQNGSEALHIESCPFDFDEPDPLICGESRVFDADFNDMRAGMRMIEGQAKDSSGSSRLRLRDIHPIDGLIVCGVILVLAIT